MSSINNFASEKEIELGKLESILAKGLIDSKILPILNIINSNLDYYSTSSCSGRVLIIALAHPGAKVKSMILGKWHDKLIKKDLVDCMKNWDKYPYLYLLAQAPILHITTHDLEKATHLRNLGDSAGFKYSAIRSIKQIKKKNKEKNLPTFNNIRITVELLSTERLNVPLGFNGNIYVEDEYLDLIIRLSNDLISESIRKIKKLEEILKKDF
jgi:tRNA wybutosine-synthesizing protein 3